MKTLVVLSTSEGKKLRPTNSNRPPHWLEAEHKAMQETHLCSADFEIGKVYRESEVSLVKQWYREKMNDWIDVDMNFPLNPHTKTRLFYKLKSTDLKRKEEILSKLKEAISTSPIIDEESKYGEDNSDIEAHLMVGVKLYKNEAECVHDAIIDTGVGYYLCEACNKSWTYNQWAAKMDKPSGIHSSEPENNLKDETLSRLHNGGSLSLIDRIDILNVHSAYCSITSHLHQVKDRIKDEAKNYELGAERTGFIEGAEIVLKELGYYDKSTSLETVEWIKCSERLPEESGRYLCYVEEVNDLGISHFHWNCAFSKEESRWSDNSEPCKVTHWMPLPAPPVTINKPLGLTATKNNPLPKQGGVFGGCGMGTF